MTRLKIKPANAAPRSVGNRICVLARGLSELRSTEPVLRRLLARLARTALGLPSAQERRAEPEPADRTLTVREQSLFRATTRRALRAATVLGGFTLTAVALPFDIGMMLPGPGAAAPAVRDRRDRSPIHPRRDRPRPRALAAAAAPARIRACLLAHRGDVLPARVRPGAPDAVADAPRAAPAGDRSVRALERQGPSGLAAGRSPGGRRRHRGLPPWRRSVR